MLKKEIVQILSQTLSRDDDNWAGVRQTFSKFYQKIKEQLMKDDVLKQNVDEHMDEIIDYIMLRLYKAIF